MRFAIITGNEPVHNIYRECITAITKECIAAGHSIDLYYISSVDFNSIKDLDCWILLHPGDFDSRIPENHPFTIFYQGEPATRPHFERQSVPWIKYSDVIFEMCGHSYEKTLLEAGNKPVKKIYIGYDPVFCLSDQEFSYEYDVGFVGARSPRRNKIMKKLKSWGYKVWDSTNLWGYDRWALIKKTKIMLEIAWADDFVYGPLRMEALYLSNASFVISEKVPPHAHCMSRPGQDFVESPYSYIPQAVANWLPLDEKRKEIANEAKNYLISQKSFGKRFLEDLSSFL